MPALRQAGGPGGRGDFRYTWNGAKIAAEIDGAVEEAMIGLRLEIESDLQQNLHKWPLHNEHQLADKAFAILETRGGRRVLTAGSRAIYALFHELGTRFFGGHAQIRATLDKYIPQITPRIRAAIAGRLQ